MQIYEFYNNLQISYNYFVVVLMFLIFLTGIPKKGHKTDNEVAIF